MLQASTGKPASGAIGDPRGVVENVAPVQDRDVVFDGSIEMASGVPEDLRLLEPIAQVVTATPANVGIGDVWELLYNGTAIATYTSVDEVVATVVTALVAAWEAGKAAVPGAADITATDTTTEVTLTHDVAGVDCDDLITATAVDGDASDDQTLTLATTVNNDTDDLETDTDHILGATSIEFDKIDGTAGKVNAGFEISGLALDLSRFLASDVLEAYVKIPDKTDVASVKIRLGTNSSHYIEWTLADTDITQAVWQQFKKTIAEGVTTGNGWDPANVTYAAVYVVFDAQDDTLADMRVDHVLLRSVSPSA